MPNLTTQNNQQEKDTSSQKVAEGAAAKEDDEGSGAPATAVKQATEANQPSTHSRKRGNGAVSRSKARKVNSNTKIKTIQAGSKHEDKKERHAVLDDVEMYRDTEEKKAQKKKAVVDLRASAQRSLMNTVEQQREANMKLSRKKRNEQKMKRFAETIGVEDNNSYPRCKDRERLIINVSTSKYFVVRFVAKHLFNYRLSFKQLDEVQPSFNYEALLRPCQQAHDEDWDIFWTDNSVQPERIAKMKPYQKTNHFPGMFQLSRKNHLARNLIKMSKKYPKEYKFFPRTFLLPAEWGEFKNSFANKTPNMRPVYIVKPEASCQGKGIFLVNGSEDIKEHDHYVVQQYIRKPLLIEGLKFDCRLYVLVLSVDPLRVYLFKEGLARFSTEPYQAPCKKNLSNLYMHLTNYSINSKNKGVFQFNKNLDEVDTGHKRTFTSILQWISENIEDGERKKERMMLQIEQIIIRTLCTVQPSLKHYLQIPNKAQYINDGMWDGTYQEQPLNSQCFEILGYDILIDEKLKPWLIEINHAPSFGTDTCIDFKIKKDLLADTLQLLGMSHQRKRDFQRQYRYHIQRRMLSYGRSKYAAYPTSGNKANGFLNKVRKDSTSKENASSIFGSPSLHQSSIGGDYIDNSSLITGGATTGNRQREASSSSNAGGGALVTSPRVGKDANKATGQDKKNAGKGSSKKQNGSGVGNIEEAAGEADSEEVDDSKIDDEEQDDQVSPDIVIEENQPLKVRENQYKQIYPSRDNTEYEYRQYIAYATQLYEQFTGSYSKKTSRIEIQPLGTENKSSIFGTSPSPIKHNTQAASQQPQQPKKIPEVPAERCPPSGGSTAPESTAKEIGSQQPSSMLEAQREFLQVHNELQVQRRKAVHNVHQQFMSIKEQSLTQLSPAVERSPSVILKGGRDSSAGKSVSNNQNQNSTSSMLVQEPQKYRTDTRAQSMAQKTNGDQGWQNTQYDNQKSEIQQLKLQMHPNQSNFALYQHNPGAQHPAAYSDQIAQAMSQQQTLNRQPMTQDERSTALFLSRQLMMKNQVQQEDNRLQMQQQQQQYQVQQLAGHTVQTPQYDKPISNMLIQQNQGRHDSPLCSREQGFLRLQQLQENQRLMKNGGRSMINHPRPGIERTAQVVQSSFVHSTNPNSTKPSLGSNFALTSPEQTHPGAFHPSGYEAQRTQSYMTSINGSLAQSRSKTKEMSATGEDKLFGQRTVEQSTAGVFQYKQQFKSLQEGVAEGATVLNKGGQMQYPQKEGDGSVDRYLSQRKHVLDGGKIESMSSGEGQRKRMPQNSIQILMQRSHNAKSVMTAHELSNAAAASLTQSIAQGPGAIAGQAASQPNNPNLSYSQPTEDTARQKYTKTISATRNGGGIAAPGDIVFQMSSPQPKNTFTHSDHKLEGNRTAIQIVEQEQMNNSFGPGAAASLIRRLDYGEASSRAAQKGTNDVKSAQNGIEAAIEKQKDANVTHNRIMTRPSEAARTDNSLYATVEQHYSLSCQPSASRLGENRAQGIQQVAELANQQQHLREQTNEYLKNSNIMNQQRGQRPVDTPTGQASEKGQQNSIQKKSLSMKPIPSTKDSARPIQQPAYLAGASNMHSMDKALNQQVMMKGQAGNQIQGQNGHSPPQIVGQYSGGHAFNHAAHGAPSFQPLNNFKDLNISLKLFQGAAQDRSHLIRQGQLRPDSARKKTDSAKQGNSRLFSRHYVRDLINEQQQYQQYQQQQIIQNGQNGVFQYKQLSQQSAQRVDLLGNINQLQQAFKGAKFSNFGQHFGSVTGTAGTHGSSPNGDAYFNSQQQRLSSPTNNYKQSHHFKVSDAGNAGGDGQQKDFRYNESLLNRLRYMPHSTTGTHASGRLFQNGATAGINPGVGPKVAKSTHERPNQVLPPYQQGRDSSVPFSHSDFMFTINQGGVPPPSSTQNQASFIGRQPKGGSDLKKINQHGFQSIHFNGNASNFVQPRQSKQRKLNIKQ